MLNTWASDQFGLLGHLTCSFAINPPLSTHLFIHPPHSLPTYPLLIRSPTHLPTYLSVFLSTPRSSTYPSIHSLIYPLPTHLPFTHSSCTHLPVHPFTHWPTHSSIIHLSIHLPTCSANPCKQTKPVFETLPFIHCQRGEYFFFWFFWAHSYSVEQRENYQCVNASLPICPSSLWSLSLKTNWELAGLGKLGGKSLFYTV